MTNKKPVITYSIIAINIIVFIIMFVYDSKLSYTTLVDFGAKVNYRIVDFKLWHLITPAFLHSSLQHLLFNSMALFYFGSVIEQILGYKKYLFSYILIAIIATMGSFIFTPNVSLGASGVIYGFMAFHLYLYILNKEYYIQVFGNSILQLIVVNVIITFIVPNIDIAGHFVGFLGGFCVYILMVKKTTKKYLKPCAIVALIIVLSGFFYQFIHYKNTEDYYISKGVYLYQKNDIQKLIEHDDKYKAFLKNR